MSGSDDDGSEAGNHAPPRRGRGRPATPPEELRARLIDAAERRFEAAPFEDVGVMEIVREAKMSSRSFYRFFENKADIALALARERAETFITDMRQIVETSSTTHEMVDRILMAYLRDLPMVVADLQRVPPSTSQHIEGILDEYRGRIADVIVAELDRTLASRHGATRPDPMAVLLVIAGIEGMSIRYNTRRRREDLVALHPQILAAIRSIFGEWVNENQPIR